MKLMIGLMSGTSMDGIDAALMDVTTHTLIKGITRPYGDNVRTQLQEIMTQQTTTPAAFSQLNTLVGREFAQAVHQLLDSANVATDKVTAIGSHGQTICHDAFADIPYTVQLGCAHTIAEETGLTVVADFRARDLVLGGQGAPFAPLYHQALFARPNTSVAVVNIGGIANVTYLTDDIGVSGHDIGPGNCLMDAWVKKHTDQSYDANGEWATSGELNTILLNQLLHDPYFKMAAPKSIGKEYFSLFWLEKCLDSSTTPCDVQATLLALTAQSIANDIQSHSPRMGHVLICGGGVHNLALLKALQQALPDISVDSTMTRGVDPDFIEAMLFAWLAEQTLNHKRVDLTRITGSKKASIMGAIYC